MNSLSVADYAVNGVLLPRPEHDAGEPDGRHLRRGRCPLDEASVVAGARWRRRNLRRGRGEEAEAEGSGEAAAAPPLGEEALVAAVRERHGGADLSGRVPPKGAAAGRR